MKILISANNYPTPEYPLQAFIGVLCEELTRQGHDVTVVAPVSVLSYFKHGINLPPYHYVETVNTDCGKRVINIYRPKVFSLGEGRFIRFSSWISQKIVSRCAKNIKRKFDALYAHFWSSALNILDYAECVNTPLFVVSGEDIIGIRYLRSIANVNRLRRRATGVICVSSKNKDESISKSLTSLDKCIVLPNAVDSTKFYHLGKLIARKALGYPKEAFIVAFCGRFNERKGVMRLSDAIQKCNDRNIKSLFIGQPADGSVMEPNCNGILFKGVVPHEKVALYLNAADVYVLPTLAEGCSNSIVEAMACGLPIISSDLPFNNDILDDSNAILIDPNNIDAIKDAILKLKDNEAFREKLAHKSLDKAKELTIDKRVKRIVGFIESKING